MSALSQRAPNRFSWREFSGALGDLGLFIPLVVAMASVGGLDLGTILIGAGVMNVATGWYFRQPIPVQPMKAIAAVVITEGLSQSELLAAGLLTGVLLCLLALTPALRWIERSIPKTLVRGIQLGVGLKLAAKGVAWVMALPAWGWDSVAVAVLVTLALLVLVARRTPGLLWIFCAGFGLLYLQNLQSPQTPDLFAGIGLGFSPVLPPWPTPSQWQTGLLRGALPQLPLTLLNSVIAVCALSGDYFPGRAIGARRMALSVGLMNLVCCPLGAVPMCHGSGGLAAQYRFGARTGGSVIMLGLAKIALGGLFGSALLGLLGSDPRAILGPMLVLAGIELARACTDVVHDRRDLGAAVLTAAVIVGVNTFVGFLVGAAVYALISIGARGRAA